MAIVTEEKWNMIYHDIYNFLWKRCEKKGKTEQECKEIMKEIKRILVEEEQSSKVI